MPSPLRHSIIFFLLSFLFLGTLKYEINYWETGTSFLNILCLFLILSIGISHGALDHLKGYKLLDKYKITNNVIFYLSYLLIGSVFIFLWFVFPSFTLLFFLIVSIYHFGKEDLIYSKKPNFFKFFLLGSPIILAPLSFHFEKTLNIFKILYIENQNFINALYFFEEKNIFIILLILFLIFCLYFAGYENMKQFLLEKAGIIILNFTCHPLIAFTIYFCFLHSVRHSFKLANELNEKDFKKGFREFLNKALTFYI